MFDLSNEVSVLKTRIKHLEQRRKRLLATIPASDSQYWISSDLERIDTEIREAREELAKKQTAE